MSTAPSPPTLSPRVVFEGSSPSTATSEPPPPHHGGPHTSTVPLRHRPTSTTPSRPPLRAVPNQSPNTEHHNATEANSIVAALSSSTDLSKRLSMNHRGPHSIILHHWGTDPSRTPKTAPPSPSSPRAIKADPEHRIIKAIALGIAPWRPTFRTPHLRPPVRTPHHRGPAAHPEQSIIEAPIEAPTASKALHHRGPKPERRTRHHLEPPWPAPSTASSRPPH